MKSSAEQKEPTQPARSRKKLSKKGPVDKAKGSGKQTFECADLEILGRIVRWIRKNRKGKATMTQVELAQRMSEISGRPVDQATVSRIESGDRAMSLPTFNALSQAVEIPGNCLLMLAIKEFGEDQKLESLIRQVQDEVSKKYLGLGYVALLQDLPAVKK